MYSDNNKSQGSVATHLRCDYLASLQKQLQFCLLVKEFLKLIHFWQSYMQKGLIASHALFAMYCLCLQTFMSCLPPDSCLCSHGPFPCLYYGGFTVNSPKRLQVSNVFLIRCHGLNVFLAFPGLCYFLLRHCYHSQLNFAAVFSCFVVFHGTKYTG